MRAWRAIALAAAVAVAGAVGTLVAGAVVGMDASELAHLAALIAPALAVTLVAIALARPLLSKASMRQGMVAIAVIGSVAAIANLVVLARQMVVDDHDLVVTEEALADTCDRCHGLADVGPDEERVVPEAARLRRLQDTH